MTFLQGCWAKHSGPTESTGAWHSWCLSVCGSVSVLASWQVLFRIPLEPQKKDKPFPTADPQGGWEWCEHSQRLSFVFASSWITPSSSQNSGYVLGSMNTQHSPGQEWPSRVRTSQTIHSLPPPCVHPFTCSQTIIKLLGFSELLARCFPEAYREAL